MAKVAGKDIFPDVKLPKKKRPYKARPNARHPHKRLEDEFRNKLIKYLRIKGCRVTRVEPKFRGEFSLGDLWVLCERTGWGGWVECKSPTGQLSKGQIMFRDSCYKCNVNYVEAKSIEDCHVIIDG